MKKNPDTAASQKHSIERVHKISSFSHNLLNNVQNDSCSTTASGKFVVFFGDKQKNSVSNDFRNELQQRVLMPAKPSDLTKSQKIKPVVNLKKLKEESSFDSRKTQLYEAFRQIQQELKDVHGKKAIRNQSSQHFRSNSNEGLRMTRKSEDLDFTHTKISTNIKARPNFMKLVQYNMACMSSLCTDLNASQQLVEDGAVDMILEMLIACPLESINALSYSISNVLNSLMYNSRLAEHVGQCMKGQCSQILINTLSQVTEVESQIEILTTMMHISNSPTHRNLILQKNFLSLLPSIISNSLHRGIDVLLQNRMMITFTFFMNHIITSHTNLIKNIIEFGIFSLIIHHLPFIKHTLSAESFLKFLITTSQHPDITSLFLHLNLFSFCVPVIRDYPEHNMLGARLCQQLYGSHYISPLLSLLSSRKVLDEKMVEDIFILEHLVLIKENIPFVIHLQGIPIILNLLHFVTSNNHINSPSNHLNNHFSNNTSLPVVVESLTGLTPQIITMNNEDQSLGQPLEVQIESLGQPLEVQIESLGQPLEVQIENLDQPLEVQIENLDQPLEIEDVVIVDQTVEESIPTIENHPSIELDDRRVRKLDSNQSHIQIIASCVRTLSSLSCSKENIDIIYHQGGINMVINLTQDFCTHVPVVAALTEFLARIASSGHIKSLEQMMQSHAVPAAINILEVMPENVPVAHSVMDVLSNISLDPQNIEIITQHGGVSTCVNMLKNHVNNERIVRPTVTALARLTSVPEESQSFDRDMPILIDVLEQHENHENIVKPVAKLLRQGSIRNPSLAKALTKNQKSTAIINATMKKYSNNSELTNDLNMVLEKMKTDRESIPSVNQYQYVKQDNKNIKKREMSRNLTKEMNREFQKGSFTNSMSIEDPKTPPFDFESKSSPESQPLKKSNCKCCILV